jgi:GNAT superfamily N-acetyltransferase
LTLPLPTVTGYTFRHMRGEEDIPAIVEVINASRMADGLDAADTVESMTGRYRNLVNCDPARDVVVIEGAAGAAAFGRTFWLKDSGREVYTYLMVCFVRAEHRQRGIGTSLLGWLEARARQVAAENAQPREAEANLRAWVIDRENAARALMEKHGYAPVRYFHEMVRPNLDDIPDAPLPVGLEVRLVQPEHLRAIWEAKVEVFRDHWGEPEHTEDDYLRFLEHAVEFQPEVWKVAWDKASNQVAGMVLGYINAPQNEQMNRRRGWTENIGVLKPWRNRGVARALIAQNLRELKARGMDHAALGVDTGNATGALRLYESMGFRSVSQVAVLEKALFG